MPARDGTGPLGQGTRTGRGMGSCVSPKVNVTHIPKSWTEPTVWLGWTSVRSHIWSPIWAPTRQPW